MKQTFWQDVKYILGLSELCYIVGHLCKIIKEKKHKKELVNVVNEEIAAV